MQAFKNLQVYLSFLIVLFVDLLPFLPLIKEIKPSFILLTLIYWNLALPDRVGLRLAFSIGILVDIIEGTLLGSYALIYVFISFICQKFFYQFRVLRMWQQCIIIFILFFSLKLYLIIDFFNLGSNSFIYFDQKYIFSSIIFATLNSIGWIFIYFLLRFYRRRWVKN